MSNDARRADLLRRMHQVEDNFVERKTTPRRREVVDALVAFANAVPVGCEAVLFLGVGPDRKPRGLQDADAAQRDVRVWATEECFPPIAVMCEALEIEGKETVAVIVPSSPNRPHFAGHAHVRIGSETVKATGAVLDELIASRNTKTGRILQFKRQLVTVECVGCDIDGQAAGPHLRTPYECRIDGCDAFSVQLEKLDAGRSVSILLNRVELCRDTARNRGLKLLRFPDLPRG